MKTFLAMLTLLVLPLQALAKGDAWISQFKLPTPELETLPNGLTVAWFLDDRLPLVDLAVLIKSGSRNDLDGKSGTAELVSNLLDKGAGGKDAQTLARAIEKLGASRYLNADDDTFSVGLHGLSPDAGTLLALLGDLTLRPEFTEAEFKKEQSNLLDRWEHIGDYAETLAALSFQRILASGTPYARGGFWNPGEFRKVTLADVRAYHKTNFTPSNALLMVVGNVDKAKFGAALRKDFGAWTGEAPPAKAATYVNSRFLPANSGQVVFVSRTGVTQSQIRMGFRAPSIHSPDRYALAVANTLLGEYFESRLNSVIRDRLGLTYGIDSDISFSRDLAVFSIQSSTRSEMTGDVIRKAEDILRDVRDNGVTDEEVATAKDYLIGGFPIGASTLSSVASRWLAGYIYGLGTDYLNEFIPHIRAVTTAEVSAAVKKHLDVDHLTIVVAGERGLIEPSLKKAGYGSIKVLQPGDFK